MPPVISTAAILLLADGLRGEGSSGIQAPSSSKPGGGPRGKPAHQQAAGSSGGRQWRRRQGDDGERRIAPAHLEPSDTKENHGVRCGGQKRRPCTTSGVSKLEGGLAGRLEGLEATHKLAIARSQRCCPRRGPGPKAVRASLLCAPLPGLRALQLSAGNRFQLGTTRRQRTAPPFPWCRPRWRWAAASILHPHGRTRQMRRLRAHWLLHYCLVLLHAKRLDQVNGAHSACMELTPSASGRRRWRPMARRCAAAGRCPQQSLLPLAPLRLPPLPQALHVPLLGQHPALAGCWQGRSGGLLSASGPRCCCAASPRAVAACRSCCRCAHG